MSQDSRSGESEDDWDVLRSFLPQDWQAQAKELGALRRCRKFADAATMLEMYRGPWQIAIAFQGLKSVMGLGHLKKTDVAAAKAWIHGKLLVAFLIEALSSAGENFPLGGDPIV